MGKIKEILLDLLYPRHCPLCGNIRPFGSQGVCGGCVEKLERVQAPRCFRCGKHIENEEVEYCSDCVTMPKSFMGGYPVFEYTGQIKKALYDFKYKNQRDYGSFFADCIVDAYGKNLNSLQLDAIISVPIHKSKWKVRGYNQAHILGKEISKRIGVPVFSNYLKRCVNTNPQKELNDKARFKNLKSAFKTTSNKLKLNKVLLVDDIYTTGATIEACTRVLMNAGVKEVYYTSVAIGQGFGDVKEEMENGSKNM